MKRFWIAAAILLCLIGGSIAGSLYIQSTAGKLTRQLERVVFCAEQQDFKAAEREAEAALAQYEKAEPFLMICIKTTPLEKIEEQFKALPVYAREKDRVLLIAGTVRVSALIEQIRQTEQLSIVNLF